MKLRHLGYLAVLITLVGTTFILLGQDTTPSPTPFPNPNSDTVPTGSETVEATQAAQIRHLMDMNNQLLTLLNQNNAMLKASEAERQALSLKIAKLEEQVMANSKHPHGRIDSGIDDPTPAPAPPVAPEVASVPVPVPTAPPAEPTPTPVPRLSDLPDPPAAAPPGQLAWRRILQLKGTENKRTDVFHIYGSTWRVVWHNKDPAGEKYQDTSALFIHAFPRDDTVPQEVCNKLGTGGDTAMLRGPGNFYLVIEGAGGVWECAVEDNKDQP